MTKHYHFIGIGGIGMSGLARLLLTRNFTVTGSDIAFNAVIEDLIRQGAVIHKGHLSEHVPPQSKVVYSTDIKPDNPEFQAALDRQCALLHRSDLLAELLQGQKALAVAGSHGKTTTSSLLATVLIDANLDPSFAIGGILPAFQSNARLGEGEYFVFEADESDRSFLKYHPFGAIITNIDHDHLNHYEDRFDLLVNSFKQWIAQVQSSEHLFWCCDDPSLFELHIPGQSYGFHSASDWRIVSMRQEGFNIRFDLEHQGHLYQQIELALLGRHNVLNAAAVFGFACTLGVSEECIRRTFKTFKGVLRRCEQKGTCHGVLFLDDYAHHPTEIQTTLQGIRQAIGPKRLIAVFQPHRYSRTHNCLGQYGAIFESVDEVILTDIYGAGEVPIPHLSHQQVLEELQQYSSAPSRYVPCPALGHYLSQFVQPYDVVVTLGAGDITKLGSETLSLLEKSPLRHLKIGWIWDHQMMSQFKEKWQLLSFPYLTFYEFGITDQGDWVMGKNLGQLAKKDDEDSRLERLPLSVIQELMDCDVVLSLLSSTRQEVAIQGFLDVLGKPYIGCDELTGKELFSSIKLDCNHSQEWKSELEQFILFALQDDRWRKRT